MTPYEKHINDLCARIRQKVAAGETVNPTDIEERLEAGNPFNERVHRLCADLGIKGFYKPRYSLAQMCAHDAREEMGQAIGSFIDRALKWHAYDPGQRGEAGAAGLHAAFHVDVGLGKTHAARLGVKRFIDEARARGLPHRVLWLVPTHRLSAETIKEFDRIGVIAAIWRGREAENPDRLDEKMCRNIDAVKAAQMVGADVRKSVCGKASGAQCPFFQSCRYLQQMGHADGADVVITSNNVLFSPIAMEGVGLVVIDEAFWSRGIIGARDIAIGSLTRDVTAFPVLSAGAVDQLETDRLLAMCQKVERAANTLAAGAYLTAADLAALSLDDVKQGASLEWRRKIDADSLLRPDMPQEARAKAVEGAQINGTLSRRAEMWRALEAVISGTEDGRIRKAVRVKADGSLPVLELFSRHKVSEKILRLPVLHLDATLPLDIVRVFFPDMRLAARIRADTPYQHVTQIFAAQKDGVPYGGWGKTSLVPAGKGDAEDQRRAKRLEDLRDFIRLRVGAGSGLVITYKDAAEFFADIDGVKVAHFNAISGLDEYGSVEHLFVIGRPLANGFEHERILLALKGAHSSTPIPEVVTDHVLMADGGGDPVSRTAFSDEKLEVVRQAISDAEVAQAIGRARGVNRSAANPVRIYLFSDVVTPFPVEGVVTWGEVAPDVVEKMILRGGAPLSATHAHRLYPALFVSEAAAKMAINRYKNNPHKKLPRDHFVEVEYQMTGPREKMRKAICRPGDEASLKVRVEADCGPIARFNINRLENEGMATNPQSNKLLYIPLIGICYSVKSEQKSTEKHSPTSTSVDLSPCENQSNTKPPTTTSRPSLSGFAARARAFVEGRAKPAATRKTERPYLYDHTAPSDGDTDFTRLYKKMARADECRKPLVYYMARANGTRSPPPRVGGW